MATTEHEVAVFEHGDGSQYLLVWIDQEDVDAFSETYTEDEWQTAIEQHPFITERKLPVVIAFEKSDGTPRLYGPSQYVDEITEDFDWDNIKWGHQLTLDWDDDDGEEGDDEDDGEEEGDEEEEG